MLEKLIESKVCKHAVSLGWLTYKFSSPNNKGVPDRIFIRKGFMFFIEFKQLGKKPTKLQHYVHELLRAQGMLVYVIDSVTSGKELFDNLEDENVLANWMEALI